MTNCALTFISILHVFKDFKGSALENFSFHLISDSSWSIFNVNDLRVASGDLCAHVCSDVHMGLPGAGDGDPTG